MRTRITLLVFAFAWRSQADVTANWQFDDGAPPDTAATLVTEANAPTLNGAAGRTSNGVFPKFDSDRPGTRVWSSFNGPLFNATNSASLRFVNAGVPNSQAGSVVTVPDNNPLLRASNLTVEAFVKIDRHVNWGLIVGKPRTDGGGTSWSIGMDSGGKPFIRIDTQPLGVGSGTGYNASKSSGVNIEDGQWHHVAFNYTNRTYKLYVDYLLRVEGTTVYDLVYDTNPLRIGQGAGFSVNFDGWIDEVRISDTVLQPYQFMQVAEFTNRAASVYLPFDDGTNNATAGVLTNTFYAPLLYGTAMSYNGGAKPTFSSAVPPATTCRISDGRNGPVVNLNSGSLFFVNAGLPGNPSSAIGGQVSIPGAALSLLTITNFTAEAFIKVNRFVNFPQIIGKNRSGGVSWWLGLSSASNLIARFDTHTPPETSGQNQLITSPVIILPGQWHHVAITYDYPTKTARLFCDYENVREGTTTHPLYLDDGNVEVGAGGSSTHAFDGWIDEVRLTPRVLAPSEFLYTVPIKGTTLFVN